MRDARVSVSTQDRIEALYREQGARMWRSVLAFTGDREVASDAVAEAFAQALGRGAEIRDPSRWVWKAAFRIAAGELKRRRRAQRAVREEAYDLEEPSALLVAMAKLSPKQRGALTLHYYGGYSAREAAEILGSTTSAVKVHLSRGRRRLRRLIEQDPG